MIKNGFKKSIHMMMAGILMIVLMEVGARCFWTIKFDVPFFHTEQIIFAFYPELKGIEADKSQGDGDVFKILMLGGSVLDPQWSSVEQLLNQKLLGASHKAVRIYNLAKRAQTSLDSYYKYKHLQDSHFDLVVFYHGINETRSNNCPPEIFREDYSHYLWYRQINNLDRQRRLVRYFALPYTLNYASLILGEWVGVYDFMPPEQPDEGSTVYGADIKSRASFRSNVGNITKLARRKNEPVFLMTFASYVPDDYSKEKFESGLLDYSRPLFPVELWGLPENVMAGIAAHNTVLRDLADHQDGIYIIDQERLLPKSGNYFHDICHLNREGVDRFVSNMIGVFEVLLDRP